jgi:hypothetical protein
MWNITGMIKSRKIRLEEHAAHIGGKTDVHRILAGNPNKEFAWST